MYLQKLFFLNDDGSILSQMYRDINSDFQKSLNGQEVDEILEELKNELSAFELNFDDFVLEKLIYCFFNYSDYFMRRAYKYGVDDGIQIVFNSFNNRL